LQPSFSILFIKKREKIVQEENKRRKPSLCLSPDSNLFLVLFLPPKSQDSFRKKPAFEKQKGVSSKTADKKSGPRGAQTRKEVYPFPI